MQTRGENEQQTSIMRIYVLGYMGSGKTTQGRNWPKNSDLIFYDLDALIEDAAGMKVAEIFAEKGTAFQRAGSRCVAGYRFVS